jgi:hypothetical protein
LNDITNTGAATGGVPARPHATIALWAVVECHAPDAVVTRHVVGTIATHARLSADGENHGEAYIGSPLASLDLDARRGVNHRGKLIVLVGEPLPSGAWPAAYEAMLRRAERAWGLPPGTTWARIG